MPIADKEETPIYFSMKMPEWFLNLGGEEKIQVVKKMAVISPKAHTLTEEELLELLPVSAE
jgi:hypothetical protein